MTLQGISDIYFNKGLELARKKDLTNAAEAFYASLDYNENNWNCLNALGLCLYRLGKFSEARTAWLRSCNINSNGENYSCEYLAALEEEEFKKMLEGANRAIKLSREGKYKDAIKVYEKCNIHKYSIVSFENVYGLCNYAIGKRTFALGIWKDVLDMDSGNEEAVKYIIESAAYRAEEKGLLGWFKNIVNRYRE